MKIARVEGAWLLHYCTKFQLDILSRSWIIVVWKLESRAHTQTHLHTHKSGRQLKIIFCDVLDHSEYSYSISNFSTHENIAFSVRKQKLFKSNPITWIHLKFFWVESQLFHGKPAQNIKKTSRNLSLDWLFNWSLSLVRLATFEWSMTDHDSQTTWKWLENDNMTTKT